MSRHLMIITEDTEAATDFIEHEIEKSSKRKELFIGSDFEEDVKLEGSYRIINSIIGCIESNTIVILQNLDNIY